MNYTKDTIQEIILNMVFCERPHQEDWEYIMHDDTRILDEPFELCEAYEGHTHSVVKGLLKEKYEEIIDIYNALPPRIPNNTFLATYLAIGSKHPLYSELDSDEERMINIETWNEAKSSVTNEERGTVEALIKKGVTEIILAKED